MNNTKLLVKNILEHAEHYEWELKGLGIMRTYLSEDAKLHVWDSRYRVPNVSMIHEHPWTFESTIIAGCLHQARFTATPMLESAVNDVDVNPYMRSIVQCGPGGCLLAEPTLVHLNTRGEEVYGEGERYQQVFDEIHRSFPEDGTVTIVRRVDYKEAQAAAVYWPHGEEWVSSDPVMATPGKIRDIANYALRRWFQVQ